MINVANVSKSFGEIRALEDVTLSIKEGNVFGMIGTNGAGKSTLLRLITGIMKADSGIVEIDNISVYDNVAAKELLYFIADEPYFFQGAAPMEIAAYLKSVYKNFDMGRFAQYLDTFELEKKRKINTFSKGMKKQLALICGLCSNTKYLLCDETFDGLDPVMRQGIKSIFAQHMEERGLTPVIAGHNLRELEDICDHVGLLHKGGVLLSKDLIDMKCSIQKLQCVFRQEVNINVFLEGMEVMQLEKKGRLYTITLRSTKEELDKHTKDWDCIYYENLPLSLEDIFISETEVVGYDIKKLLLD